MKAVLKFGGSILAPNSVDFEFLEKLASSVSNWSAEHELAIVVGGGKLSREFGKAGKKFTKDPRLLDLIGIQASRFVASTLISALDQNACPEVPRSEAEFIALTKAHPGKIIVAGGFRPGQRTDAVAVEIAKTWGAELVVKGTDVDYVYDSDPKKNKDAKPLETISYEELKKLGDQEHEANKATIMDKVAAEMLAESKIKMAIVNGKDLANIEKILSNQEFTGTRIGF
ncbi:MAG: UMP kinase [archaeon]